MAKREKSEGEKPGPDEPGAAQAKAGDDLLLPGDKTAGGGDPPSPLIGLLSRIDDFVGRVELVLVAASLALMVGAAVYQFVAVNLLSLKADWADELIRYSVFFTAMSAAALAAQHKKMMAIDVVPRLLQPRVRAITRVGIAVMVVFACYLLLRGGLMARESMAKTPSPYHVISGPNAVLALPIGAALIGFHFLIHAVIDTAYLVAGKTPPANRMTVH